MGSIRFKRISPEESRIYSSDGDYVGDVYAHDDILNPGARVFLILLDEDPRALFLGSCEGGAGGNSFGVSCSAIGLSSGQRPPP